MSRESGAVSTTGELLEHQVRCCGQVRERALAALSETVHALRLGETSEHAALDIFAAELARRGVGSYWYPAGEAAGSFQSGCIVAFDTAAFPPRTAFSNARHQAASDKVLWEGFGYFYASPQVLMPGGLVAWGDVACTIYLGKDPSVRAAVRDGWQRNKAVLGQLGEIGTPTTLDLFRLNAAESEGRGLVNIAWSQSGEGHNLGHHFPVATAASLDDPAVRDLPSARCYVDGGTDRPLSAGLWTYEARDRSVHYPTGAVGFHEIVTAQAGRVIRLPSCRRLLESVGMDWVMS